VSSAIVLSLGMTDCSYATGWLRCRSGPPTRCAAVPALARGSGWTPVRSSFLRVCSVHAVPHQWCADTHAVCLPCRSEYGRSDWNRCRPAIPCPRSRCAGVKSGGSDILIGPFGWLDLVGGLGLSGVKRSRSSCAWWCASFCCRFTRRKRECGVEPCEGTKTARARWARAMSAGRVKRVLLNRHVRSACSCSRGGRVRLRPGLIRPFATLLRLGASIRWTPSGRDCVGGPIPPAGLLDCGRYADQGGQDD
jgi:hypothetical protein